QYLAPSVKAVVLRHIIGKAAYGSLKGVLSPPGSRLWNTAAGRRKFPAALSWADATSASHIPSASQPRSAARTAMRPLPPRPKPRPGPGPVPTMPPATYLWPTTAAAHPAGWYAIACTEEERRQHKCDDQISALPR